MQARFWITVALAGVLATGCATGEAPPGAQPDLLPIVAKSIEFHGGDVYEHSTVSLTITSLSGSFDIVSRRQGPGFDYTVTRKVGQFERRVRYTNDTLEQWDNGEPVELDEEAAGRARAYVDARVFFPFLPYVLKGGDIYFEDQGLEAWDGRELQRVKVTFTPGTSNDADDSYLFWFDPDTGQLEQFGYDFDGGSASARRSRSCVSEACSSRRRRTTRSTVTASRSTRSTPNTWRKRWSYSRWWCSATSR